MIAWDASPVHWAVRSLLALLVLPAFVLLVPGVEANADEVVIANPSLPYKELSANALRAIFGMRLRAWPDGSRITVYVLNDGSPAHARFTKQKLSIFPHQLRLAWDRLVYSGTGQAPLEVGSELEMRAKVAATTDAIGYLSMEVVDDSVRVLQIK